MSIENRLTQLFARKRQKVLNIYFTAGYPTLESIPTIISQLAKMKVDLIEIGIPYSDPLADGKTIQDSSQAALRNGITLSKIFDDVTVSRRDNPNIPLVLMGYYNQMLQFGVDKFIARCISSGVDGLIIPDLPMSVYEREYQSKFEEANLSISFLITPQTSDDRIRKADELSSGFIYVVSQSSITGKSGDIQDHQVQYFEKLNSMNLSTPKLIGFGIHDKATFEKACDHGQGAIIGSAFIRSFDDNQSVSESINNFVSGILG